MIKTNSIKTANRLLRADRLDDAQREYQKLVELRPKFAWNYYYLGHLFAKQRKWQEAVTQYRQAITLNPNSAHFYNSLAEALIQQGELDRAINYSQKATSLQAHVAIYHQTLAEAFIRKGDKLNKAGKAKEAVEYYQQGLELNPIQPMPTYRTCGNNLIALGRLEEAKTVFQKLKELLPELPGSYSGYASLMHHLGDWEFGLKWWEEAITKFPDNIDFQIHKGNALINLYRFDEAEAVFTGLKEKYPNLPQGYERYAALAHHLDNWELALKRWEEAIFKFPEELVFKVRKGNVLVNLYRFDEAEAVFTRLKEKYPNLRQDYDRHLTALLQAGILASQQGNRELALEKFERAIEIYNPQKAIDAYILAATELKYLGRESEADAKYEQILSFHQQRGLYSGVKLLGTSLTSIQELGLLLDRLAKKQLNSPEDIVTLATLIDKILFPRIRRYTPSIAKDAISLLPKFKILKELFWQVIATQSDRYFLVLKHFNMAIQLLEKESQRLNNGEWRRVRVVRSETSPPLTDKLCFTGLASSARYVTGTNERMTKSQVQATVKYLPKLMDEEKKYFEASIRKLASSLKLRSSQNIDIFKDFICEPPFGVSQEYILPWYYYHNAISQEFISELDRDNTGSSGKNISDVALNVTDSQIDPVTNIIFPDPRSFLEEIAISEKALDNYYKDDLVFGLNVLGHIWGAYQNYGHLLCDQIPSLILYQKLNLSCKIFVPHITDSHWEIFSHLNIPKEKILVKHDRKFKYFMIARYQWDVEIVNYYRSLKESILANHSDIPSEYRVRYVYISRKYSHSRQMANEMEVEELMVSLGFSIVYAEKLNFEEKAMLMHHAAVVVSPYGTSHLNCLMCHPGTTVVAITPPGGIICPYNFTMCCLGLYKLYPLLGERIGHGWKTNIGKLKRVITAILEDN